MKVFELLDFVTSHAGELGREDGVREGDPNAAVTGVLICFMATLNALQAAQTEGCNLVVTHESPFLPYDHQPEDWRDWSTNSARFREIVNGGLTVVRLHASLDRWLIYDTFREELGLPNDGYGEGFCKVYYVEPRPMGDWIEHAKSRLGLANVRFVGDPRRVVCQVGLPFGGLSLFVNIGAVEKLIAAGADLLIGGESDDYAMRYMADAGVCFIELGHSSSENPGLARFAGLLREHFRGLKVVYYNSQPPYRWA